MATVRVLKIQLSPESLPLATAISATLDRLVPFNVLDPRPVPVTASAPLTTPPALNPTAPVSRTLLTDSGLVTLVKSVKSNTITAPPAPPRVLQTQTTTPSARATGIAPKASATATELPTSTTVVHPATSPLSQLHKLKDNLALSARASTASFLERTDRTVEMCALVI